MTPTPTERIVLFPEPLRHSHLGRRAAAVVCLAGAVGAAGWTLARDTILQRWHQGSAAVAAITPSIALAPPLAHEPATSGGASPVGAATTTPVTSNTATRTPPASAAPRPSSPAPPPSSPAPAATPPASPSTTPTQLEAGVHAFAAQEYDGAAALLRQSLRQMGTDSANTSQRVRALTFLGAAELKRGHNDSSIAAFRQLLTLSPRKAPDSLMFEPEVMALYHKLRSQQQGVARIATTPDGVALTIIALSPHRLRVGVGKNGKAADFQLFSGVVTDSVVVTWNGAMPGGASASPGAYEMVLDATPTNGPRRSVRFPVLLERDGSTGALHARVPPTLQPPNDR